MDTGTNPNHKKLFRIHNTGGSFSGSSSVALLKENIIPVKRENIKAISSTAFYNSFSTDIYSHRISKINKNRTLAQQFIRVIECRLLCIFNVKSQV
jgi:hypothetical protein